LVAFSFCSRFVAEFVMFVDPLRLTYIRPALQYLGSQSIVRVDWARAAGRFENLFYTARKDPVTGVETRSAPNVLSMWRWIVDFLTADFQQRASFVAGLALGLRVG
jgi:FUN14 domain-containing protein 1